MMVGRSRLRNEGCECERYAWNAQQSARGPRNGHHPACRAVNLRCNACGHALAKYGCHTIDCLAPSPERLTGDDRRIFELLTSMGPRRTDIIRAIARIPGRRTNVALARLLEKRLITRTLRSDGTWWAIS